jgi:hypothetical protein
MPKSPWALAGTEPSINELLSEPIVHLLMQADGVAIGDVFRMLTRLHPPRPTPPLCRQLQPALTALVLSEARRDTSDLFLSRAAKE